MSATAVVTPRRERKPAEAIRRGRPAAIMRLILRRLGWLVPLLVALSLLVFALAELSPADASSAFLGSQDEFTSGAGRQGVEQAIAQLPWWQTWLRWLAGLVTGDLGSVVARELDGAVGVDDELRVEFDGGVELIRSDVLWGVVDGDHAWAPLFSRRRTWAQSLRWDW